MKKYFSILFCCGFILTTYAGDPIDRIVAIVNNGVIVESELKEAMHKIEAQLSESNTSLPAKDVLRTQVLNQLVNNRLQLQLADMAGIEVTDKDVDKVILSIAKKNRLTTEQLYEELNKRGISKEDYQKNMHDEYLMHQIQEKAVAPTVSITPQEVDDFMRSAAWLAHNNKEYHLEDILITLPDAPTTDQITTAKKRAESLLVTLRKGADFNATAVAESESSKALQGGDLGWRKLPEIPSAFSSQILLGKEGDIIGPIQTSNGFHIIHIAGIRSTDEPKEVDQQKQVQQFLFERKFEEALQRWLTKIRGEAFIDLNPKG